MTLLADVRAAVPGLRDALPEVRVAIPDLREIAEMRDRGPTMSDIREAMPDLREVLPDAREAIRESLSDLRADLPSPWRRERPSLARRIAIVVVAGVAITAATWLMMAFLERRRLSRTAALKADEMAVDRAEGEGMTTAMAGSAGTRPAATGSAATSQETTGFAAGSGIDMDAIRPLVGARTNPNDGGTTDGR